MSLCLTKDQLQQARSCWNNVQQNNKYHKDQFITRLFSNLLAANTDLRGFFKNDVVIREHSLIFNDLLNYIVIYLDNIDRLDQFLGLFFKENDEVVKQINYLEPMGTALIQTFRQWLGRGLFNEDSEQLWVQIYIHLANNILVYTDDDNSSFESNETIEEIEGLNIQKAELHSTPEPEPTTPASLQLVEEEQDDVAEADEEEEDELYSGRPQDLTRKPSLQVNIKSNEKYRGFRRNDSPVVEIAELPPRSLKRDSKETLLSSPSRNLTSKFNNLKPKLIFDEEEETEKGFGFDPRKSNKKKSSFSEPVQEQEKELPTVPRSYDIDEKPEELDITLQPIVELESDNEIDVDTEEDNSSSIYHSDNSEPSSTHNSLSLHSHFSDGTEATEVTAGEPMSKLELRSLSSNESKGEVFSSRNYNSYNSRQTSISSVEPEFVVPKHMKQQSMSLTDLGRSIQLSQRASLGFMRSSFILKKEIDTLGFNKPENVGFAKPPTIPAAMSSVPQLPKSSPSPVSSEDESYDMLNSFMPIISEDSRTRYNKMTASCTNLSTSQSPRSHPNLQRHSRSVSNLSNAKHNNYSPMETSNAIMSVRKSNAETSQVKNKKSFRDRIRSLFGSSKESLAAPQRRSISQPLETTYSSNSNVKASNNLMRTSSRTSSKLPEPIAPTPVRKTRSSVAYKRASAADLRSINTMETNETTSGFSFFDRRSSTDSKYSSRVDRKKNKYNVTKTPYDVFAHNKLIFS